MEDYKVGGNKMLVEPKQLSRKAKQVKIDGWIALLNSLWEYDQHGSPHQLPGSDMGKRPPALKC